MNMQEFEELFYRDAYAKEFDAKVISCEKGKHGYDVVLEDTAFYPEGGGQPADLGTLNGIKVLDVKRKDKETIVHVLETPVVSGDSVHGVIDWERRFDHMQQHSGEHIVSGLIHQRFGYENIGFHMGEDVVTIDFNGPLTWEDALQIEEQANRIIWQNMPVEVSYPDSEALKDISYRSKKELQGQVRIVAIPQADVCACCGTHVRRTGELGLIKLFSLINRKNGVRIEMASGMRAYRYIKAMQEENTRVSHLFSAKPLETGAAAERVQNELNDVKLKLRGFQKEQLRALYEAQPENEKLAVLAMDGLDMNDLRAYCNDLIAQKHAGTACGLSLHGDRYTYVMISETVNLRDHAKTLNALLDGKGGGNSGMIQGSFGKGREEILKALKEEFDHD